VQRHGRGALGAAVDGVARDVLGSSLVVGLDSVDELGRLVDQSAMAAELRPLARVRVRQVERRHRPTELTVHSTAQLRNDNPAPLFPIPSRSRK